MACPLELNHVFVELIDVVLVPPAAAVISTSSLVFHDFLQDRAGFLPQVHAQGLLIAVLLLVAG